VLAWLEIICLDTGPGVGVSRAGWQTENVDFAWAQRSCSTTSRSILARRGLSHPPHLSYRNFARRVPLINDAGQCLEAPRQAIGLSSLDGVCEARTSYARTDSGHSVRVAMRWRPGSDMVRAVLHMEILLINASNAPTPANFCQQG
jgi:hypothetical protein